MSSYDKIKEKCGGEEDSDAKQLLFVHHLICLAH